MPRPRFLRKKYVVPSEHGSWVWWMGPFLVGLVVGGAPGGGVVALFVAALAAFLLHQPAAVAVKALVGRYPRTDLAPALTWLGLLGLVGAAAVPCLLAHDEARALVYVVPGAALFAWHLRLVARREERRHAGMALLSGGALAFAAPAAYVVAGGADAVTPWVLWALCAVHTAASITTVYLRLDQRAWKARPGPAAERAAGRPTLVAHAVAIAVAAAAVAAGRAPAAVLLPFVLAAADGVAAVRRPSIGARPARVGMHQLAVDVAFALLLAVTAR
ncbi:MAG: YwiC-like family protein [Planctomycetia bacterium]|nr:YwiC-like family protein [Planctomycetia bacterium]